MNNRPCEWGHPSMWVNKLPWQDYEKGPKRPTERVREREKEKKIVLRKNLHVN